MIKRVSVLVGVAVALAFSMPTAQAKNGSQHVKSAPAAIVFVIDRSGSMSGMKIQAAKQAVLATIAWMPKTTRVAVISFDTTASMLVKPTSARGYRAIKKDVKKLQAGGGTNIFVALNLAYKTLRRIRAKKKHVILLTDGQSPYSGLKKLAALMRRHNMTVSAIGIGAGADTTLLKIITTQAAGRFYQLSKLGRLSSIFQKDVALALK